MKKLFGIIAIAAIAAIASWNFIQSQNEVELSDLVLANIDALANDGEISSGWENKDCYMDWEGGMGGSMNKVCKCWTPGDNYHFCI